MGQVEESAASPYRGVGYDSSWRVRLQRNHLLPDLKPPVNAHYLPPDEMLGGPPQAAVQQLPRCGALLVLGRTATPNPTPGGQCRKRTMGKESAVTPGKKQSGVGVPAPFLVLSEVLALLLPAMGSTPPTPSPCLLPVAVLGGGGRESQSSLQQQCWPPESAGCPWTLGHRLCSWAEGPVGGVESHLRWCSFPRPDWELAWSLVLAGFVGSSQRPGDFCGTLAPSPVYVHQT